MRDGISPEEKIAATEKLGAQFAEWMDAFVEGVRKLEDSPQAWELASGYLMYMEHDYNLMARVMGVLADNPHHSPERERVEAACETLRARQLTGVAPDFTLSDKDGKHVALSSLRGRYVLLDFWASWCAPCRNKNRELAKMWPQLREAGLEIVSVSLDDDHAAWRKAMDEDGIGWLQLIDPAGFKKSEVRAAYKFEQIPSVFLISPDGEVLATNPSIDRIGEIIRK